MEIFPHFSQNFPGDRALPLVPRPRVYHMVGPGGHIYLEHDLLSTLVGGPCTRKLKMLLGAVDSVQ